MSLGRRLKSASDKKKRNKPSKNMCTGLHRSPFATLRDRATIKAKHRTQHAGYFYTGTLSTPSNMRHVRSLTTLSEVAGKLLYVSSARCILT